MEQKYFSETCSIASNVATLSERLIETGVLRKYKQNDKIAHELIRITIDNIRDNIKFQQRYLYCWIEPKCIINKTKFEFEYYLIIYHKNELYFYSFIITYHQIQELHSTAIRQQYFSSRVYPTMHSEVNNGTIYRNRELQEDMKQEQDYMILEDKLKHHGPGRKSFTFNTPREATMKHAIYFGKILRKLFNCPQFAIHDEFYRILNEERSDNIVVDIISLLKDKANVRLTKWRDNLRFLLRKYHQNNDNNALYFQQNGNRRKWKILKDQKCLKNIMFHSVIVASRANGVISDHWSIIFEGKYHLLILDYFQDIKSVENMGFVSFRLMQNNIFGQRTCWYSFCASTTQKTVNKQLFNVRWNTLRKLFLPKSPFQKEVSFNFIHELVKISMNKPEYFTLANNCQHFVRNIFAVFDSNQAKYLNVQMDHRKMTMLMPSMPVGDVLEQVHSTDVFLADARKIIQNDNEYAIDNWQHITKQLLCNQVVEDEKEYTDNDFIVEMDDNFNDIISQSLSQSLSHGPDAAIPTTINHVNGANVVAAPSSSIDNDSNQQRGNHRNQREENKENTDADAGNDEKKSDEQILFINIENACNRPQCATNLKIQHLQSELIKTLQIQIEQLMDHNQSLLLLVQRLMVNNKTVSNVDHPKSKKQKQKKKRINKQYYSINPSRYQPPNSCRAQGNIQIERQFTEKLIPSQITEKISNIFGYIDKSTALQMNKNDMISTEYKQIVINYDFHDEKNGEELYCIINRQNEYIKSARGYKWKMDNKLYSVDNLKQMNVQQCIKQRINRNQKIMNELENELKHHKVSKLLMEKEINGSIITKTKWHKKTVYGATNNNKTRMTLCIDKEPFIGNYEKCVNNDDMKENDIYL